MLEDKKTALIIEDDPFLSKILFTKFTSEGFEVLSATDGQTGLDLALKKHPDIILLDMVMPKMDGMAVLDKLRQDEWGKDASIMILSNLNDAKRISEAIMNNVYDFFVKADWDINDVVKKAKEKVGIK